MAPGERLARQQLQQARAAYARDETSHAKLLDLQRAERTYIHAIPDPVCNCDTQQMSSHHSAPPCPIHPGRTP